MSTCNNKGFWSAVLDSLKGKPELIAILIMLFGFGYYMDRAENRHAASAASMEESRMSQADKADLVAELRIETCHDIQEQSIDAMKGLTAALVEASKIDSQYRETVNNLIHAVNQIRESNQDLRSVVIELSTMIKHSRLYESRHYSPVKPIFGDGTPEPKPLF